MAWKWSVRNLLAASSLAFVAFVASEGYAAIAATATQSIAPPSRSCLVGHPSGAPLTLAEAKHCAPDAVFSRDGTVKASGRYIVRNHNGSYAIVAFWSNLTAVDGHPMTARTALAYSCGQSISRSISSWYWDPADYVTFNTGNSAVFCNDAWNNWESPGGYVAGGTYSDSKGVIGNHTYTVNPWLNRYVVYNLGAGSDTFFCRHYYSANDTWSGWCG